MADILKVAVPTNGDGGLDAKRSAHFGQAESFTIVEVVDERVVGGQTLINPPHTPGGCGSTVTMLANAGVTVVIVVGMGGGPLASMKANGIAPLFDDKHPTPRTAVEAFLAGRLAPFGDNNACRGH